VGSHLDIRKEGGAALVMALGVMTIMIIIGVLVVTLSINATKTVGHDIRITEAQNVAEAGVDEAIAVTLANYTEVYPSGVATVAAYGDGTALFNGPQNLTDSQGNVLGTYEIWTKQDPDRPGNTLITATGSMGGENLETSTVHVSVIYTARIFDFVLLVGDPTASFAGDHRTDSHGDWCMP